MDLAIFKKKKTKQLWTIFRSRFARFSDPVCKHDPVDIMVFITNRCNLRCTTCPFTRQSPYSPEKNTPDMPLALFKSILDTYSGASLIGLVGGEPLLHPHLKTFIQVAADRKLTVNLSTNGVLLDEKMSNILLDTPLHFLNVSLDAPDEDEYKRMRNGSPELFKTVLKNIEVFSKLRKSRGNPVQLWLSCVIGRDNIHRIPDFARLAKSLGADRVFCQNVLSYQCSDLTSGAGSLKDTPEIREQLKNLQLPDDIDVVLPPLVPLDDDCQCSRCIHPFKMLTVDGGGNLSPCCVIPPHPKYGNLQQNLKHWHAGPELVSIRKDMLAGNPAFADICLDCWERFSLGQHSE